MLRPVLFVLSCVSAGVLGSCPVSPLTTLYRSLSCSPRFENGAECPTSYDCSKFETRSPFQCHSGEQSYNISDTIEHQCKGQTCTCNENQYNKFGRPRIECLLGTCAWEELKPGCNYQYNSGGAMCCPTVECRSLENDAEKVNCTYENQTYEEGQEFQSVDDPCMKCKCQKGFRGVIEEPFCKMQDCRFQHQNGENINKGCVPIHYDYGACCPFSWKCPEPTDAVLRFQKASDSKTSAYCTFGKLFLKPGDTLIQHESASGMNNIQCTCDLPPFITCKSVYLSPPPPPFGHGNGKPCPAC